MNHRIPLCIVTIVISLCLCIVCAQRPLSAKSNLSSADRISVNVQKSITIAAYDTIYYYFFVPSGIRNDEQPLRISLSNSDGIELTALNSSGERITLTKYNQYFQFPSAMNIGERCFLRIANSLPRDQTLSFRVFCTDENSSSTPKTSPSTQTKKENPSKEISANSKKDTSKSSVDSQAKKGTSHSSLDSHKKKSTPHPSMDSQEKKSSPNSHKNSRSEKNSYETTITQTPIPDFHQEAATQKPHSTKKTISKSKTEHDKENPYFASTQPLPKKHFLRITKGTSLALAEQIFDEVPTVSITMKPSSDDLSITNGIVFVPKEGLYYITLKYSDVHTTCTIKVD